MVLAYIGHTVNFMLGYPIVGKHSTAYCLSDIARDLRGTVFLTRSPRHLILHREWRRIKLGMTF